MKSGELANRHYFGSRLIGVARFINTERDLDDWEKLTEEQQQGIVNAIDEIDAGKGIAHEKVMENMRKKYSNN